MKKIVFVGFMTLLCTTLFAAQTLNNPIGTDGCYIVKWDCQAGSFASANDFEVDETFTFAIDITGTQWVQWLAEDGARRLATNFGTNGSGNGVSRDGDRLFHIQGNIWGKTIKLSQMITSGLNTTIGQQQAIYANLFGFDTNGLWWLNPSEDIVGNSDCFFRTAAYTGTHTCPNFTTSDYAGNPYTWINQGGYAVPCVVEEPCYSQNTGGGTGGNGGGTGGGNTNDTVAPGSQVYRFATDQIQRGYYNRPYERYEAEPNYCSTNGQFLAASDNQRDLQSEASHQQAVVLNNVGDYVSWVVNKPGDGLTVRFSLPDGAQGQGTDGNLDIYAGEDKVGSLYLNSYWAWQYCDGTYPDNNPRTGNVVIRMRFDENHVRLSRPVESGEVLKLVKTDKGGTPYTIDFAELEPVPAKVTFESLSGNKVQFDGNGDVGQFIMNHQGQTIYIPEGTWNSNNRIYLRGADGTQVVGAGMWYTQIYFSASSDVISTHNYRGIEADRNNLLVEGIYFNTVNNKRYCNNNSNYQVGKGFMGCWGYNSVIRNCWVEHFECGAWFSDYTGHGTGNLLVEHCRFRNNYADGTNCSHGMKGTTLRYCSYRNNGDDDMASWTTTMRCENIKYEYCTAENNWRASSLGVFGGKNFTGHHLYIVDALECGARINSDFDGAGFAQDGVIDFHDITIEHCGCKAGMRGQGGDFWGSAQPALLVNSAARYAIYNPHLRNISLLNSRGNAIRAAAASGKPISGLKMNDIYINGGVYGIYYSSMNGCSGTYCHITMENTSYGQNNAGNGFNWTEEAGCSGENTEKAVELNPTELPELGSEETHSAEKWIQGGKLYIRRGDACYDALGRRIQ